MNKVTFRDLGLIDYKAAWDYQEKLFNEIVARKLQNRNSPSTPPNPLEGELPRTEQQTTNYKLQTKNHLLFCEHPPVITLGKSGSDNNLLVNEHFLAQQGISFYKINRGGDITFHGPGQVVGYPILDLAHFYTDIHRYLRNLEETIIHTLAEYGIEAGRLKGATGVWLDADEPAKARKICAMGVRCSRWVTMHGFALNVNTDLSYFNYIIPCGITGKQVTSMQKELQRTVDMEEVKEKIKKHFAELLEVVLLEEKNAEA